MSGYTGTWTPDTREQVTRIVGCQHINGSCITHQRLTDKPRPGCPFVDSLMRDARAR